MRPIIDADGDGVEDNVAKTQHELDRFRKMVYSAPVEDLHNTRNGELPGHIRYGDFPEPESNIQTEVDIKADARSTNEYDKEPVDLVQKPQAVAQMRPIIDADGDGVEDNVAKTQEELDKTRKMVFGAAVHDIHNTRHGELHGHVRFGDFPEPKEGHVQDHMHTPAFKEEVEVEADTSLGTNVFADDRSQNEGDATYLMTAEASKLSNYIASIQSPQDLEDTVLLQSKPRRVAIYDADGDGIDDETE